MFKFNYKNMKTKICSTCKNPLSLDSFYKNRARHDGLCNNCKSCRKKQNKKIYSDKSKDSKWLESERVRHREKYHRLDYKSKLKYNPDVSKRASEKLNTKFPEKNKARSKSSNIKVKTKGFQKHHWSYNEEHGIDFIELSKSVHYFIHRLMTYDQEFMMYRDLDGNLLDTKEKHKSFIKKVCVNLNNQAVN